MSEQLHSASENEEVQIALVKSQLDILLKLFKDPSYDKTMVADIYLEIEKQTSSDAAKEIVFKEVIQRAISDKDAAQQTMLKLQELVNSKKERSFNKDAARIYFEEERVRLQGLLGGMPH